MVDYKYERVKRLVSEFRPILAEEERLRSIMDSYYTFYGPTNWTIPAFDCYEMWEEKLKTLQREAVERARRILVLK
jgi:hypothetical protein